MGRELVENLPAARDLFDRAAQMLGYDLARLCFEGPSDELDSTVVSQPAIFVTSLAALEQLRRDSPDVLLSCEAAAGLSLGEYTALVYSGAMEFEEALRVVAARGAAMQDASDAIPSGMVSILGLEREQVAEICRNAADGETLQIANLLCPGNIVVSGVNSALERASEMALALGAMKTIPLAVAGAFHTPIMQPAVQRLSRTLNDVKISRPAIPVISNVDARPHSDPHEIRDLLIRQVVSPVLWEDSIRHLLNGGYDHFWEIGPGRVLRGLIKRIDRKVACHGVPE